MLYNSQKGRGRLVHVARVMPMNLPLSFLVLPPFTPNGFNRTDLCSMPTRLTSCIWCATSRRWHQLPTAGLVIDGVSVSPSTTVCDLDILLDADLSMCSHIYLTIGQLFWDDTSATFESAPQSSDGAPDNCGSAGEWPPRIQ
jgi:hypothetical protein